MGKTEGVKVEAVIPRRVHRWLSAVAKRDGMSVDEVVKGLLKEVYLYRRRLRDVKEYYMLSRVGRSSTLRQALSYVINLGSTLHNLAKYLLEGLMGDGEYALESLRLVEEKPGVYRGVNFQFISLSEETYVDYFTLQIQHDGIYMDATATLSFEAKNAMSEALERLKRAALEAVEREELQRVEEMLKESNGGYNIDISDEGNVIFLTFMAYADDVNRMPRLPQINDVLRRICDKAGIVREAKLE